MKTWFCGGCAPAPLIRLSVQRSKSARSQPALPSDQRAPTQDISSLYSRDRQLTVRPPPGRGNGLGSLEGGGGGWGRLHAGLGERRRGVCLSGANAFLQHRPDRQTHRLSLRARVTNSACQAAGDPGAVTPQHGGVGKRSPPDNRPGSRTTVFGDIRLFPHCRHGPSQFAHFRSVPVFATVQAHPGLQACLPYAEIMVRIGGRRSWFSAGF